jgi:hypothetical protein
MAAQCIAHASEAPIPNASQFSFRNIRAQIYNCNTVANTNLNLNAKLFANRLERNFVLIEYL